MGLLTALALQASQVLVRLRLQAELERMALHDPLTGLANRQLLEERAESARSSALRSGHPLAVVFFDLDGFKAINDRHGHHVGDAVLQEVAERLRGAVRGGDFAARFGGDEFVVICEDADADGVGVVAERIRSAVARPLDATEGVVTASIGVAVLRGEGAGRVTTDELIEQADAAMYHSKNGGRDRITVHVVP
jgi:diguanylate cyclase (GGDEF)-like protein